MEPSYRRSTGLVDVLDRVLDKEIRRLEARVASLAVDTGQERPHSRPARSGRKQTSRG